MANQISVANAKAIVPRRTPEGATSLRQILSSPCAMVEPSEMGQWITPSVRAALPLALNEARAWLAPPTNADFRSTILPALALVSPSGWSEGQSAAWQAAAKDELSGVPADLLEIGCSAAKKRADHPSKIVVEIYKAIGPALRARKAELARLQLIDDVASGRRQRKPWEAEPSDASETCSPEETAKILAEAGIAIDRRAPRKAGAPRVPTDEDYMREFGLTREQLAASRASDEADAAAAAARRRAIGANATCPVCTSASVKIGDQYGVCESIGCGTMWEIDQTKAA